MQANGVRLDPPLLDDDPSLLDGVEDLALEQFDPEPRNGALDVLQKSGKNLPRLVDHFSGGTPNLSNIKS